VYFALVAAGEYVVIPFMSLIFGGTLAALYENNAFYFFMAVSSKFAHLVLTLLALKIYLTFFVKGGEGVKNKEKIKGLLFAFLIPLSCLMMFLVTELLYARFPLGTKEAILLTANAFLLMLVTFAAFYLHSNTVEQAQKISRFTIEQKQREFDAQYHELMNKTGEDMQILSHDFKNHLIQLDNAANMEQVHDYVARLYPSIRNFDAATVSDNATLNVIISKYNTLCTVKGVAFRFHIESALEHLEASDLSAILNNLLDNALEAAESSEAKCIDLRLFNKNEKLETVVLTNSCDTAPVEQGSELLSTKEDAGAHGLGLKSVKKTVAKYNGFYEWKYDEEKKEFITTVSFYHE